MSNTNGSSALRQRIIFRRAADEENEVFAVPATMTVNELRRVIERRLPEFAPVEGLAFRSSDGDIWGRLADDAVVADVLQVTDVVEVCEPTSAPKNIASWSPAAAAVAVFKARTAERSNSPSAQSRSQRSRSLSQTLSGAQSDPSTPSPTTTDDLQESETDSRTKAVESDAATPMLSLEEAAFATHNAKKKAKLKKEMEKLTIRLAELRAKVRVEEEKYRDTQQLGALNKSAKARSSKAAEVEGSSTTEPISSPGLTKVIPSNETASSTEEVQSGNNRSSPNQGQIAAAENFKATQDSEQEPKSEDEGDSASEAFDRASDNLKAEQEEAGEEAKETEEDDEEEGPVEEIGDVELENEIKKDEYDASSYQDKSVDEPLVGGRARQLYPMEPKIKYWWSCGEKLVCTCNVLRTMFLYF